MPKDTRVPLDKTALRNKAEKVHSEKPNKEQSPIPASLVHELEVYQIELEMQNEELHRAHDEIEVSREKYLDLFDFAPVGYATLDEKGIILESNFAMARLLGIERKPLRGTPFYHFIKSEFLDLFYLHWREILQCSTKQTCELELEKKDGTRSCVRLESIGSEVKGQRVIRIVLMDITDRKLSEDKINSLLEEKELFLREVHHRIRNNMSVIMSLLSLQSSTMEDNPSAVAALEDTRSRVSSMLALYDVLYQSSDFRNLSTKEYLTSLVDTVISHFPNRGLVTLETNIDDFIFNTKIASPVGIILNELLTNIMKYAFIGRDKGVISVFLSRKETRATLIVQDNGVGIPESVDVKSSTGFGMQLVEILTSQLDGAIQLERENGTKFILEFEV